jgi:hypothetical protein
MYKGEGRGSAKQDVQSREELGKKRAEADGERAGPSSRGNGSRDKERSAGASAGAMRRSTATEARAGNFDKSTYPDDGQFFILGVHESCAHCKAL